MLLEKSDKLGGHARSIKIGQYWMDFGPHILRLTSEQLKNYYHRHLKEKFDKIKSFPKIYKYNTFFDHVIPIITRKNIELLCSIKGYKLAIQQERRKSSAENFEEYLINIVGEELYWEFFGEYSQKWWGISPRHLDVSLAPTDVRIGDIPKYVHYTIETPTSDSIMEVYPRSGGFQTLANHLSEQAEKFGVQILTKCNVTRIECNHNTLTVVAQSSDKEYNFLTKRVYLTCPINIVAEILNIKKPPLDYRGILFAFFNINGETKFKEYSWIYIHESRLLAGRAYDSKYYYKTANCDDWTSICIEIPINIDIYSNALYEKEDTKKLKDICLHAFEQLVNEGLIKIKSTKKITIRTVYHRYSYPLFVKGYKNIYRSFVEEVKSISDNIKLEGRNARFEYLNSNNILNRYLLSNWPFE